MVFHISPATFLIYASSNVHVIRRKNYLQFSAICVLSERGFQPLEEAKQIEYKYWVVLKIAAKIMKIFARFHLKPYLHFAVYQINSLLFRTRCNRNCFIITAAKIWECHWMQHAFTQLICTGSKQKLHVCKRVIFL